MKDLDCGPRNVFEVLTEERRRERVITPEEEARYLAAAPEPLASIGTVLADTGLRPEECFRLRWEDVTWVNGRHGALLVTRGKTAAARRVIPMTPRVRAVLESRWNDTKRPREGRGPLARAAATPSSIRKQHGTRSRRLLRKRPSAMRGPCVRLCSTRCGTRS
jgi:integrase